MSTKNTLPSQLGKIQANLLSLELVLRVFLQDTVQAANPAPSFSGLHKGDLVPVCPLTNYDSLATLLAKVNDELARRGVAQRLDTTVVALRDALAHGRLLGLGPDGPYQLVKFGNPKTADTAPVDYCVEVTEDWTRAQIRFTHGLITRLVEISRSLGLPGFPR